MPDKQAVPVPNPTKPFTAQQPVVLLAMCIWGEARGESREGKMAVGCVVRNRVQQRRHFGDNYTDVILKPFQFSSFNAGDANVDELLNPLQHDAAAVWAECYQVAELVYNRAADVTGGATHYSADGVPPLACAVAMLPTVQIGRLSFFREA